MVAGMTQGPNEPAANLSERELEIVTLLVGGLRNQEIAEQLGLSKRTAQAHVASAMRKTGTCTRTQLAVHALRVGLVALHPTPNRHEGACDK